MTRPDRAGWAERALGSTALAALVVVTLFVVWRAGEVLLVAFAGVILALSLRGASDWLAARLPLGPRPAVGLVALTVVGVFVGVGWLLADELANQLDELAQRLPRAVQQVTDRLRQYEWGRFLLDGVPTPDSGMVATATGALSTTLGTALGLIANVVIVAFVALYVALDPRTYMRGALAVVPHRHRPRAREILHALGVTLRRWLLGRLVAMLLIGGLTALGLWVIGVRLWLTLGLLAGLLNFIPYIGPLVSFVPAALLAALDGPTKALWVGALYLAVQTLESYVVTPLVEQRAVSLPPAMTLTAQVVLGVIFGFTGLLVATPLTAVAMVMVDKLYVEDTLGEPGSAEPPSRARAA